MPGPLWKYHTKNKPRASKESTAKKRKGPRAWNWTSAEPCPALLSTSACLKKWKAFGGFRVFAIMVAPRQAFTMAVTLSYPTFAAKTVGQDASVQLKAR